MNNGAWHQFGDRSQRLALEQLQHGAGVGVILSPRDLSYKKAREYAFQYREAGAEIIVDQQFYIPESIVGKLDTYPISAHRKSVSHLNQVSESDLDRIASDLRTINSELHASALLAPAVVYEAGRPDIVDLNSRLFAAANVVAQDLGIPCYATLVVGQSATTSDATTDTVISAATGLQADGWYFAFEFNGERIPSSSASILRYLRSGLSVACTGQPVLHAYAGPLAPLALASGATAVGIGHSQNLWQFTRHRWTPTEAGGGGGAAPPRYFSKALWGTIIYEDEFARLPRWLRERIVTPTPFSSSVNPNPPYLPWTRWDANKHFVFAVCETVDRLVQIGEAEGILDVVSQMFDEAISVHSQVAAEDVVLADSSGSYQQPWRDALASFKESRRDDFELLRMLQ